VDVRTDADGAPLTIENVPELVAANHRAASALGDLLRREGAPEAQVALVMDMVAALTSEEVVVASALREPQLFMLAAGGSFRPGATVTYQEMLPNPFGGEPFPSTAWFRLAQVDAQAGSATVEWGQSLDRERASGLLQEVLRLLVERTGAALPDGATIPELPLAIDDAATIIMDVRTGWPQSVHWERATTAGAARQVERVTFRARPGELG
ncbi:MAG TPA: hypothetical protein VGW38_07785, partial [Chloroflexota bacterium]|nr:hypothetical protein [Chloroflexota bacterium]